MEPTQFLTADFLDIVFEGRNKEYGAYELRSHYKARLNKALLITVGVVVAASLLFIRFNKASELLSGPIIIIPDNILDHSILPPKKSEATPAVAPRAHRPVKTVAAPNAPVKIVPDAQAKPVDPPSDKIPDDALPGATSHGGIDASTQQGPAATGGGSGEKPAVKADDNGSDFKPDEIESSYPGGVAAWSRYLGKSLRYPDDAAEAGTEGDVIVRFVVDTDGSVSDVEAVSGPEELRAEAVRVIRRSGKWTPARQNGRFVRSYKQQPVKFRLQQS